MSPATASAPTSTIPSPAGRRSSRHFVSGRAEPDDIARWCDLLAHFMDHPRDDETALVVLRRPESAKISDADKYIFRVMCEAAVGLQTMPWACYVITPDGVQQVTEHNADLPLDLGNLTGTGRARAAVRRVSAETLHAIAHSMPIITATGYRHLAHQLGGRLLSIRARLSRMCRRGPPGARRLRSLRRRPVRLRTSFRTTQVPTVSARGRP